MHAIVGMYGCAHETVQSIFHSHQFDSYVDIYIDNKLMLNRMLHTYYYKLIHTYRNKLLVYGYKASMSPRKKTNKEQMKEKSERNDNKAHMSRE